MFIADTSLIVCPFAKTAARRRWAQDFLLRHAGQIWTTEAAFAEASHLIGDPVISARILSDYRFELDLEEEKAALATLLRKYAPEMDFADATLVRLSERRPAFKIVTDDSHFEWYRRFGKERLPVLWLPEARN